ncbi:hypothetical protein M3Y99_00675200 [Aphelenchoides fujianensis]|nr:hypothetical protein M3Y99_00675200 [Aphelenchoides fujianensis]
MTADFHFNLQRLRMSLLFSTRNFMLSYELEHLGCLDRIEKLEAEVAAEKQKSTRLRSENGSLLSKISELEQQADESTRSPNDEANDRPASTSSS